MRLFEDLKTFWDLRVRWAPNWWLRCTWEAGLPGWLHAWVELHRRETLDWVEDEHLDPDWKDWN